jgi:hypothetical protein
MSTKEPGSEELGELAEEAMSDKRDEVGGEDQSRELWDVPTESAGTLADQQEDDA